MELWSNVIKYQKHFSQCLHSISVHFYKYLDLKFIVNFICILKEKVIKIQLQAP